MLVLALPGALLGVLLARRAVPLLFGYAEWLAAPERIFLNIDVDGPVIAFAAIVACACALVFGFMPALQSSRVDLVAVVNEALDVWARARGRTTAVGRAALDAGLQVVVEAFCGLVGPGNEEDQDKSGHNVGVIIPPGDPLRDEILAAVERGASVTIFDSGADV